MTTLLSHSPPSKIEAVLVYRSLSFSQGDRLVMARAGVWGRTWGDPGGQSRVSNPLPSAQPQLECTALSPNSVLPAKALGWRQPSSWSPPETNPHTETCPLPSSGLIRARVVLSALDAWTSILGFANSSDNPRIRNGCAISPRGHTGPHLQAPLGLLRPWIP